MDRGVIMKNDKIFDKTHYELVCYHLNKAREGMFTKEMLSCGDDPDFKYFSIRAIDSIPNYYDDAVMTNYLNVYFHMYHMKKSGSQIYYVTPELSARLAQTSLNIDTFFLKSPFREIYVQIDPGLFYIYDAEGKKVPVTGFYVYLKDFGSHKQIRVMACSLHKPTPEIPLNDTNFYFHMELGPGKLKDELRKYIETKVMPELENIERFGAGNNIDYLEEFGAFALNVLLYITSRKPDISNTDPYDFASKLQGLKSTSKRNKFEKRAAKASTCRIIVIGQGINDKNNDMDKIQKAGGVGKWKLQNKIRVPGHWRMQWYGSEKDGTKYAEQIFIDDYSKGPDHADVVNTKHIVK